MTVTSVWTQQIWQFKHYSLNTSVWKLKFKHNSLKLSNLNNTVWKQLLNTIIAWTQLFSAVQFEHGCWALQLTITPVRALQLSITYWSYNTDIPKFLCIWVCDSSKIPDNRSMSTCNPHQKRMWTKTFSNRTWLLTFWNTKCSYTNTFNYSCSHQYAALFPGSLFNLMREYFAERCLHTQGSLVGMD